MSNLYAMTRSMEAVRRLFKITHDSAGDCAPQPAIVPDMLAPIVRIRDGERELVRARWGFPPAPKTNLPITNIRNLSTEYWKQWISPQNRCLVPVTSFSEYAPKPDPETGRKDIVWFAIDDSRPLFAFAGLWRPWSGPRGTKDGRIDGDHELFGFLTTEANDVVRPVHRRAMPVILHERDWDTWLTAEPGPALRLQRPWTGALDIVARSAEKMDSAIPQGD